MHDLSKHKFLKRTTELGEYNKTGPFITAPTLIHDLGISCGDVQFPTDQGWSGWTLTPLGQPLIQ